MKRRHRLSRSRDFDAVYRHGRSASTRYLTVYAFPREREVEEGPRLGIAVSRKVGRAVARNRIKRRLRMAFDELRESLAPRDYVLVVRAGLVEAAESRSSGWLVERVAEAFRRLDAVERGARA